MNVEYKGVPSSKHIGECNDEESFYAAKTKKHRNPINDKIPARLVLYFLSWSGFLVSFMMRNDINFALLAMVRTNTSTDTSGNINILSSNNILAEVDPTNVQSFVNLSNETLLESYMLHLNHTNGTGQYSRDLNNIIKDGLMNVITNNISIEKELIYERQNNLIDLDYDEGEYDWSSTVKASILSSFYWCYVLSQVVGGIATQYFGTKSVFGWSQFATALCSLFIPYASDIHYGAVIFLRSIQGFASGLTWPAMYAIVGYWIPESERSRFMSSFQGFSIGIGLTYPLCGIIIKHFGWRYVFYTTGTIGMSWCVMWYFLAFNTPEEHPRITKTELNYIHKNINHEVKNSLGMKVPWKSIFMSIPAWSIGITTFGRIWVHYQFILSGPNYMKNILGFKIESNGLLSGLPFLFSYIASVLFCYAADYFVAKNWMTLTNVRKLFTAASQILPGVMLLAIGYIDDNIVALLIIWNIAVILITAAYAGAMANVVDIAPNLAGPVLAFAQSIHMTASFLSPLITGFIVTNEKSITQWQTVFGLSLAIAFGTYIVYQIFGTSEIQPWNYPKNKELEENEILSTSSQLGGEEQNSNGEKKDLEVPRNQSGTTTSSVNEEKRLNT